MENYGKISAEAYDIWFPEQIYEDTEFFKTHIEDDGQPALEIGCGTGRLLLHYRKLGLEVEGLDYSHHMLEICHKKARDKKLQITTYQTSMQEFGIDKRFRTIFVPWGSFMLLSEEEAKSALKKFHDHLLSNGKLIVVLFNPAEYDIHTTVSPQKQWRLRREGQRKHDGAIIKCWEKVNFNKEKQIEQSEYRYEIWLNNKLIEEEKESMKLLWYSIEQFHDMLKMAGFQEISVFSEYTDKPATSSDKLFTFIARKTK